jgi:hypothetical protein
MLDKIIKLPEQKDVIATIQDPSRKAELDNAMQELSSSRQEIDDTIFSISTLLKVTTLKPGTHRLAHFPEESYWMGELVGKYKKICDTIAEMGIAVTCEVIDSDGTSVDEYEIAISVTIPEKA